jgi:tetratricopeptide (TPR) repeat protein
LLRGQTDIAKHRFSTALIVAVDLGPPSREAVAWCRWQLGEVAFSTGDYETAESHYRDALITYPNYYRALASLGRVLAARGDLAGGIEQLERAARILPDAGFVALLGDLYKLAGRDREATASYELVEQIARLDALNGALYNRQIAIFYADHDMKADEAYRSAEKEFQSRKDIYGADALAWAALKAGKVAEAQSAIKEALRLGTRDAKLYYHAGMIAKAAGDRTAARSHLERALKLSPQFDPLQAEVARKTLQEL